jgi:transforming growth factor-beta-induced protein
MYKTYMTLITSLLLMASAAANAGPGKRPGDASIYEIAKSTTIHTTLVALLDRVGLGEGGATDVAGQFTVFAPTDEAFNKLFTNLYANLPADTVDKLLESDEFITGVLLYHVADGRRFSNSVFNSKNMKEIETLCAGQSEDKGPLLSGPFLL